MNNDDITVTIEVNASPHEVFNAITRHLSKWWGGDDLTGSTTNLNDEFVINHPGAHYSKQKLIEVVPDKKVVWLVTESTLSWLTRHQHEWTNTKMIFDIAPKGDQSELRFTHEGLGPEKESYERVSEGWNTVIKGRLFHLVNNGGD